MGGGLMQLVAYGAQDVYLTGNPLITFFKVIYRRHTNFAAESIEQTFTGDSTFESMERTVTATISRNGDLITNTWLQVKMPKAYWCDSVGHAMIKSVELEIGGQKIDKWYGETLEYWQELTATKQKQEGYELMTGKTTSGIPGEYEGYLHVPLQFFFNRHVGLALPLIALQYHEVKVKIVFRAYKDLLYHFPIGHDYDGKTGVINQLKYATTAATGVQAFVTKNTTSDPEVTGDYKDGVFKGTYTGVKDGTYRVPLQYADITDHGSGGTGAYADVTFAEVSSTASTMSVFNIVDGGENYDDGDLLTFDIAYLTRDDPDTAIGESEAAVLKLGSSGYTSETVTQDAGVKLHTGALNSYSTTGTSGFASNGDIDTYAKSLDAPEVKLFVDYIYLDTDERRRFAQVSHEMLIEQVQFTGSVFADSSSKNANIKLNFNHPVKELVWTIQETDREGMNDYFTYKSSQTGGALLDTAKLSLNGHDRFSERPESYFRLVQPYQHHTKVPQKFIYCYSFALKPEEHQPSGTCNFSRIDNATLNIKLIDRTKNVDVKVYAHSYNVLRIMSGMGGLAFSN